MTLPPLIDFHCHVDLFPDPPALVAACDRDSVFTLAVTTTPKAWPQNHEWTRGSRCVRAALGLHPQLAAERAIELELFDKYLPESRYVGEVGLDAGPRYANTLSVQEDVFVHVLRACAREGNKVLSIHSVRTVNRVLGCLEQHLPSGRGRAVLHWFTGSRSEARRAAALGCYFSVNSRMLESKRAELVDSLPDDRLLTETDGPFVLRGDQPSHPPDVKYTIMALAARRGWTIDYTRALLANNLKSLLT